MRYGAVIAAGGRSERMKRLKELMKMGDISITERLIANFRRAGVEDIVVVSGSDSGQLGNALKKLGVRLLEIKDPDSAEMFDYAKAGLECLCGRCGRIFFCPAGVPFFSDETVAEEMAKMDSDESILVVIPSCGGKSGHPLLIAGESVPAILSYSGNNGMRGAYRDLPAESVYRLEVEDRGTVTDEDTGDEYHRLAKIHSERLLHPVVKVIFASTTPFFGPGTVSLLRAIDENGNVRDACAKCGFSYSKAWTLIRSCEERIGSPVVERQHGGQSGGSARVTEKGHDLIKVYEILENELAETAENRFNELMQTYNIFKD